MISHRPTRIVDNPIFRKPRVFAGQFMLLSCATDGWSTP